MKPKAAKKEFEKYAKEAGLRIKQLNAQTGLHFMCAFYRHYRAEDCPLDGDGDMLLYEWGTYKVGGTPKFQLGITRQFMKESGEDEDMSQLRLIFLFPPTSESAAIGSGNRWCHSPDELQAFESFIASSVPYRTFGERAPESLEFYYQDGL